MIRAASLSGFPDLARACGLDPLQLAAEAGFPSLAFHEPELKILLETSARLLELAASRAQCDNFGIRLAEQKQGFSGLGMLGLIMRDQPTLRKVIESLFRYISLHADIAPFILEETGDIAILRAECPVSQRLASRHSIECTVGSFHKRFRSVMPPGWRPYAVLFRHSPPADLSVHRRVFGIAPRFGQDLDAIVIRQADMDAPLPAGDPEMAKHLELHLEQLLAQPQSAFRDRVARQIQHLLPHGTCSAEQVAELMGIESRTLSRKLAAEGTSFRALLDEKRSEMAVALIAHGRSFLAVSDQLGFSSPSVFTHWFRRQFGQSPSDYRAAVLDARASGNPNAGPMLSSAGANHVLTDRNGASTSMA